MNVYVEKLPKCDFCESQAEYDAKTIQGPWANMCATCWFVNAQYVSLGLGKGQKLCVYQGK